MSLKNQSGEMREVAGDRASAKRSEGDLRVMSAAGDVDAGDLQMPIKLLWTGGWDSTYWLAYATLVKRYPVHPIYVIDARRKSTLIEIQTMGKLREWLLAEDSEVSGLLGPVEYHCAEDVVRDEEVIRKYQELRRIEKFGKQYDWLTCFALQHEHDQLHMCIEKSHNPRGVNSVLKRCLHEVRWDGRTYHVFPESSYGTASEVFSPFVFPTFHLTKQDMQQSAEECGFEELLSMTWFCHSPRRKGVPCGVCVPCIELMKIGMPERLRPESRLRYHIKKLFSRGEKT